MTIDIVSSPSNVKFSKSGLIRSLYLKGFICVGNLICLRMVYYVVNKYLFNFLTAIPLGLLEKFPLAFICEKV